MGADILERLPRWKTGPVLREHPGFFLVPEADIDEAAAEIGRLRGEVARWKTLAEDAQVMHETAIEVGALVADIDAIAPAMPNAVQERYPVGGPGHGWLGEYNRGWNDCLAAIRAADNRDAAGVTEEKGDVLLDYVLPCDVAVAPATKISKGVRLRTLISAIRLRESDGPKFEPGAGFRALFDTPQPAGEAVAVHRAEGWPPCPECKAGILYECPACSSTNYPRDSTPAAVHAGEAVAWLASDGEVFTDKESADRHSKVWGMNPLLTPLYTTPQPADGEAVARDPYAPTDGEVLADFMRVCRESKPVGQWPGERVCAAIERLMENQKPFRFIAETDMAPERDHNGRGGDAVRMTSGPRRTTPPAPVQAAPQEGEWPDYVMLRDTKLHDDAGGLGQRIFTTAGAGYTKVKYVRADLAAHPSAGDKVREWLRTVNVALREVPIEGQDDKWFAAQDALSELRRYLANPSACELGAVRELVKLWRIAVNGASTTNKQDLRPERFIRELEAALQHRGDSRGGEGL